MFLRLPTFGPTDLARMLHPKLAIKRAELDGFGNVIACDLVGVCKVGDGASDFEDAIVSASAQVHVVHRVLEQLERGSPQGVSRIKNR